jgi:hypothetical protein
MSRSCILCWYSCHCCRWLCCDCKCSHLSVN